jgi:hypothetical protein
MTRPMTKLHIPVAIVSSTVGTTLISVVAAWFVAYPVLSHVDGPSTETKYERTTPHKPSGRLYRLSPIPAGADWTS